MGFSIVAFEATLVSRGFRLELELPLLASIARVTLWLTVVFMVIRIGVIVLAGDLGLAFEPTREAFLFWLETFPVILIPCVSNHANKNIEMNVRRNTYLCGAH